MQKHSGYYDFIKRNISSALISEDWFAQIRGIVGHFPPWAATSLMFEFHLNDPQAGGDFILGMNRNYILPLYNCYSQQPGNQKMLEKSIPEIIPADWQWIKLFTGNWIHRNLPFYENIEEIFFEFDTHTNKLRLPEPLLFVKFKKTVSAFLENEYSGLIKLLELLSHQTTSSQYRENLLNLFTALPENCHVFGLGFLFARNSTALRLCIMSDSIEPLFQLLDELSLTSNTGKLLKIMDTIHPFFKQYALALNVGESIESLVGLELYPGLNDYTFERRSNSELALNYFVSRNLCPQEKARALLQSHFRERDIFHPSLYRILTVCSLSHFKLITERDSPIKLKAYLNVSYLPVLKQY